jgi:hypothetical protein
LQCLRARRRGLDQDRPTTGTGGNQLDGNGQYEMSEAGEGRDAEDESVTISDGDDEPVDGDDANDPSEQETVARARSVARQNTVRQDDLGAERGGRSITIEGQPGTPGAPLRGMTSGRGSGRPEHHHRGAAWFAVGDGHRFVLVQRSRPGHGGRFGP